MYYNTTNQEGETLKEYKNKALTQENEILEFMSRYGLPYSASEITEILFISRNVPITSTRRALSNLYTYGKIKKVGKVKGMYGRPENTYQIIST